MPSNLLHKSREKHKSLQPNQSTNNNIPNKQRLEGTSITTVKGNNIVESSDSYRIGDYGCKIKVTHKDRLMDVDGHFKPDCLFDTYGNKIYSMKDIRNLLVGHTGNKGLDNTIENDKLFVDFVKDLKYRKCNVTEKNEKGYSDELTRKYCKIPKNINSFDTNAIAGYRKLMNRIPEAITYLSTGRLDLCTKTMWSSGILDCTKGYYRTLYPYILRQRDLVREKVNSNNDNRLKYDYEIGEFKKVD